MPPSPSTPPTSTSPATRRSACRWAGIAAGVPFGLQIVAPRFSDGLALGLAEVLERERPWPLVAPGYQPFWEP